MNDNTAVTIMITSLVISLITLTIAIIYLNNNEKQICKTTAMQKNYTLQQIKELCK